MSRRDAVVLVGLGLLVGGVWQVGEAVYVHTRGILAQHLLRSAWDRTLAGEHRVRPWPWADSWPVARLRVPRLGIETFLLADANGRALAPGAGQRNDAGSRFLESVAVGDDLYVETADGAQRRYRIRDTRIADAAKARVPLTVDLPLLTLVTDYPFDAPGRGGPLRYVVTAEELHGRALARAPGAGNPARSAALPVSAAGGAAGAIPARP